MGITRVGFIFARNPAWWAVGARIIEKAESIDFSHSAVIVDDYVYESVFPKSRKIPLKDWYKKYQPKWVYYLDTTKENIELIKLDCEEQMGKPYSLVQIFVIWLGIVLPFFNTWLEKIKWNGHKYLICTELCGDIAFNHFGVEFSEELDNLSLTELKEALEKKVKW